MSVANCACGEWLCGSKEQILTRFSTDGRVEEIDLTQYKVEAEDPEPVNRVAEQDDPFDTTPPRSIRVVARGADESINKVFSIDQEPLWIGRIGCHIELDDAELSIRHCSIRKRNGRLIVTDQDSHTGTFLDGEVVTEAVLGEGSHLLRVGGALICIESTTDPGIPVEAIELDKDELLGTSPNVMKKLLEKRARAAALSAAAGEAPLGTTAAFLVCIEGPLKAQEWVIPPAGLIVGREGDVRVPDEFLSRKHFTIFFDEQGIIRIRDLGSRNGTFLNTLPAQNTKVHGGDQIRAGNNEFRVEQR